MINCPKCHATLPDGSGRCQFCGASFTAAPTRPDSEDETPGAPLNMIMSVLKIALAVLMIFVIGETETRAANF